MTDQLGEATQRYRRIEAALTALDATTREPQPASDDDPLFLCAIGWRCGSTLLQRIAMTDPSILVWGEPMDKLGLLDRLADALCEVTPEFPHPSQYLSHRQGIDLTQAWVANLMPDAADFRAALRALFDTWLAAPARRRGFARWGVKEVRWSAEHALILRWLYPRSRFAILARHPVDAFRSMVRLGWDFWVRLPDRQVGDLESFARHWNEMALSWVAAAQPLGAEVLRYEDLVDPGFDFAALGERLGLCLNPAMALEVRPGPRQDGPPLSPDETVRIDALTVGGRAVFLYGD